MKRFSQQFIILALFIFHVSWGSVMATQMHSMQQSTDTQEVSISSNTVATIDQTAEAPCPHHSMTDDVQQETQSTTSCDCSNCNCINVLSSLLFPIETLRNLQIDDSHDSAFIISAFPDSPPAFILRPPIS